MSGICDKAKWWAGQVCDEHTPVCQVGASAAAVRAWWWWRFEKSSFRLGGWLRLLWNPTPSRLRSPLDLLVWLLFRCTEPRPRPAYRLTQETLRCAIQVSLQLLLQAARILSQILGYPSCSVISAFICIFLYYFICIILFAFTNFIGIWLLYNVIVFLLCSKVNQLYVYIFPFFFGFSSHLGQASLAQMLKNLPAMKEPQETRVRSLGREEPLEKELATHSSILAWRTPWTEEPGGLRSMESQRVRHDWANNTHTHTHTYH